MPSFCVHVYVCVCLFLCVCVGGLNIIEELSLY